MMILCKTIHTLLGFRDAAVSDTPHHRCRNIPSPENGGLRCVIDPPPASPDRGDPGSWGLHEAAGGVGVCTESLGSESCDIADEAISPPRSPQPRRLAAARSRRRRSPRFPPPLPWLSESNNRRSCFMKGERRDGRFLLTEVTIERPEVLRASRQNGRLRLHLVESGDDEISEEEEERADVAVAVAVISPPATATATATMRCQEATMWWGHHQRFVTTA